MMSPPHDPLEAPQGALFGGDAFFEKLLIGLRVMKAAVIDVKLTLLSLAVEATPLPRSRCVSSIGDGASTPL